MSPPTGDTDTVHTTTNGHQPLNTLTADRDPDGELERLTTKYPELNGQPTTEAHAPTELAPQRVVLAGAGGGIR